MNRLTRLTGAMALLVATVLAGCGGSDSPADQTAHRLLAKMTLEEKLAQKFVVDFRYFCDQPSTNCTTAWTQMQPQISAFLQRQQLGGVILFANNLQNVAQTVQLTHDIQAASFAGRLGIGSLITTDQEGGTVLRTPRDISTRFTGNMSIGASYLGNQTRWARATGEILGRELAVLGINVNHAPVLDVNINPNNPVINVRSFSDSPEMVAQLGLALQSGIQSQQVAATVKHFPGHGDTQVDSHYGLPLVNHDLTTIKYIDLFPFQYVFDHQPPDLVMTAHIQYPALDSTTLDGSQPDYLGQKMIRPATLSRKILTDLLRGDMRYQGVVVTDAMNMAGIAAFFTPEDAVLKTFAAGADIALMPISLNSPAALASFDRFIQSAAQAVRSGVLSEAEVDASVLRILTLKQKLGLFQADNTPITARIETARQTVGNNAHTDIERQLAEQAVTLLKNHNGFGPALPLPATSLQRVTVLASKAFQGLALQNSLQLAAAAHGNTSLVVTVFVTNTLDPVTVASELDRSQLLIVSNDANKVTPLDQLASSTAKSATSPTGSTYANTVAVLSRSGSLVLDADPDSAPATGLKAAAVSRTDHEKALVMLQALQAAKARNVPSVFVSQAAPYETAVFASYSDSVVASYNGNSYINAQGLEVGVAYQAFCRLILGDLLPQGHLPINIPGLDGQTVLYPRGHGLSLVTRQVGTPG